MINYNQPSQKERDENACARCFFGWYNHRYGVNYTFERAEKCFSELTDGIRWEFVATQQKKDSEWFAVEVKKLIRPQLRIQFVRWSRVLQSITRKLHSSLQGEFSVIAPPLLQLHRADYLQLKKIVKAAMLEAVGEMKRGDIVDLGPMIAKQFQNWPIVSSASNPKYPHEMQLRKIDDGGCSVELDISPVVDFYVNEEVDGAICALFDPSRNEMLQANKQLGLAKAMGAKRTILLLDCHFLWRPNIVKQLLTERDVSLMSNIDTVYLVRVSQKRVSKVWPSEANIHN